MKIRLEVDGRVFEYQRKPMHPERFAALCKLAGVMFGGAVLLGLVRMVGVWALVWAAGVLVAVGFYKMMQDI